MTLIVAFIAIVFLLFGYYVMDQIDKFIGNNAIYSEEYITNEDIDYGEAKQKAILIYGDNELTTLVKDYCNSKGYVFEAVTNSNFISNSYKYICLLALSYNDVDNLTISSVGVKVYCISQVITLCNSQNNLKLYNEFNFTKVLLYDGKIDKIFNVVRESVQNAVKNKI